MSPAKFYLITGTVMLTLTGVGFYLGWQHGREKFANECITIGNFVIYDYGLEKQRRFVCEEAPMEDDDPSTKHTSDAALRQSI
jgi:hypothetical protein